MGVTKFLMLFFIFVFSSMHEAVFALSFGSRQDYSAWTIKGCISLSFMI